MQHSVKATSFTPSLGECIDKFFVDARERVAIGDLRLTTLRSYESYARHVGSELRGVPVGTLRRQVIKQWHRDLAKRRHPVTDRRLTAAADNGLRFLSIVFAWLDQEDEVQLDRAPPTARLRRLHRTVGARAFDDLELIEWRNALEVHTRFRTMKVVGLRAGHPRLVQAFNPVVVLRLLDLTGARPSEIRTLRVEQLPPEVRAPGQISSRTVLMLERTKTDEGCARPLSQEACVALRRHVARLGEARTGWLFPSLARPGESISDSCVSEAFRAVCRVAGLGAVGGIEPTRYSLRHTMITRGFASGFTSTGTSGAAGNSREKAYHDYRHSLPRESFELVEAHALRPASRAA